MVKVFLHISKDEQRARLQARIDDPEKNWKFRRSDLETRAQWDEYQARYEAAITATSTSWAPWYVVPADHKWVRDVAVASLLVDVLGGARPADPRSGARARRARRRVVRPAFGRPSGRSGVLHRPEWSTDGRRVA